MEHDNTMTGNRSTASHMNPWEEISLADYEKHMSLDSVKQLQAMNEMMKIQLEAYPVTTAAVPVTRMP